MWLGLISLSFHLSWDQSDEKAVMQKCGQREFSVEGAASVRAWRQHHKGQ